MTKYRLKFSQVGTYNPVLTFDTPGVSGISCARASAGVYDFTGTSIPDAEKCRLFVSPMECENQDTGEPVTASVGNQGSLRIIGREAVSRTIADFNMAEGVYIPMVLHVYP